MTVIVRDGETEEVPVLTITEMPLSISVIADCTLIKDQG
jgi:hypothetical protein